MKGLCKLALAVAFVAACGGDGAITQPEIPNDSLLPGVLAIGVDPTTNASIETNKDDYSPGEIVHVVGKGWGSGETVNLHMTESPDTHADVDTNVVADSAGGFSIHYYDVQQHDLGVTFTLTATGGTSGSVAVATFTDAVNLTVFGSSDGVTDHPTLATEEDLGSVNQGTPLTLTCPRGTGLVLKAAGAGTANQNWSLAYGGAGTNNGTLSPLTSLTPNSGTLNGSADDECIAVSIATGALTAGTTYHGSLEMTGPTANSTLYFFRFTVSAPAAAGTETTVSGSPNPAKHGQSITITADVELASSTTAVTTGSVEFRWASTMCSNGTLLPGGPFLLDGSGQASTTTSFVGTGTAASIYNIRACYLGAAGFAISNGEYLQTVDKSPTTTSVDDDIDPSTIGQSVTFTATVAASGGGVGASDGTVSFWVLASGDCSAPVGTLLGGAPQALVPGFPSHASVSYSALPAGSHTITACYSGEVNYESSSGVTTHSVNLLATTTEATSSANPSVTGQPVIYTATVKHNGSAIGANGSVEFRHGASSCSNGILFATVSLDASGQAATPPQTYNASNSTGFTVFACYTGTTTYAPSRRVVLQEVQKANTSLTATDSDDPSVFGQPITLGTTVTVVSPGTGTPTGNVKFWELTSGDCDAPAGTQLGATQTLSGGGTASVSYSGFSVGSHTITVCYAGDNNYNKTSQATTHLVNKAQPTLTLTTNGPVYFGTTSTFTATMGVPFSGMPTGTVKFYDGGTCNVNNGTGSGALLGTGDIGDVLAGKAVFSSSSLNAATYNVVACYGGDDNFLGATDSESHVVNKATTSLILTSTDTNVEFGDAVTFTAAVTVTNGVANTNGGIVKFAIGGTCDVSTGNITAGTPLTTAQDDLSGGTAAVTVSDLPVGNSQTITACYGGNSNIVGSGDTETQTVTPKTTTLALTVTPGTQQYSDKTVFGVTITPAEVNGSPLTGVVYLYVNGAAQACGTSLPAPTGSVTNFAIADADDGAKTFTYTIDKQASTTPYVVTACFYSSNTNFKNSSSTGSMTVNVEEAVVFNEAVTPGNIAITGSGQLTFSIKEKNPETNAGSLAAPGDLTKIVHPTNVVVTASGIINPSNQIPFTCTRTVGGSATPYTQVLNYTCDFGPVPTADTYDVSIDITGNYYDGAGAALIQVTDPAAGFTTGGGWYWHNGVVGGEKVNFGFMAKATVNNKKTNYQGSLLVIRHKSTGEIIKVKSNVFEGYSIGTTVNNCTPASFSGKATYAVNGVSAGNFAFVGYGVDCGEPGTADKFGLYHAHTPTSGYEIGTSTTAAGVSGVSSLKTITGGNIQVPQPSGGGRP